MSFFTISSERWRPSPLRYVCAAVALATMWFAAIVTANVLIDPEGVFGLKFLPVQIASNERYRKFQIYKSSPRSYDAAFFSSSRGGAFPQALLAQLLGVNKLADFWVPGGQMSDHLPVLEFLLRDKAARGERLKAAFLLLDADIFGTAPWTNSNIDSFLPPELSDESRWRFWSRYLTVFQFKNWRTALVRAFSPGRPQAPAGRQSLPTNSANPPAEAAEPSPVVSAAMARTGESEIRPDVAHQLELLGRFVTLCREHGVRLTVVLSPLNLHNPDATDRQTDLVISRIAALTPVWDFGRPEWLTARSDLWNDNDDSHYRPAVAVMMLHRVFGGGTDAPPGFGRLIAMPAAETSPR